ncbi:hypothetical protein DSC45_17880 [Streptomyces sp. YIM 130001]|uniref:helix-turn-helix domain-containing protein n=1 Tax=Streptomyces sp. YIM 130001 TaxID=2259644 RepID=UPI000E659BDB|nr:helix-turn-helix transcriptional regulator [Streptomyces sp. YIM 130001]RII15703.1 hypothetical protein DSC45_17880 [Streptomyces sp. YIM 130001]
MSETPATETGPPFDAAAARRLRQALGMAPGHVAYGVQAGYGLHHVTPDTVTAWERGLAAPSPVELTALAGALWCAPSELLGAPVTLREHRLARGLATEDVAREAGVEHAEYLQAEASGNWRGTERQSAALARVLDLGVREFATATGLDERLTELLRGAVAERWQSYVRPLAKLLPLERDRIADVLGELHGEYQASMVATLSWGGGDEDRGAAGRDFLDGILDHFWDRAGGG